MSRRLGRDDWTALALRVLAEEGDSGLTVERLCAAAGRTRGSLYHHFADHDTLLAAVVDRWRQDHTERVIEAVLADPVAHGPATLNRLAMALDPRIEVGIRRLAARYPSLRDAVRAADHRRIGFLAELNVASRALPASSARALAEIEYAAYIGFQHLDDGREPEAIAELYHHLERLLARGVA